MASYDFSAPRLFVDAALSLGLAHPLDRAQQNYLSNVLRLSEGEDVIVFNGRDGEWRAAVRTPSRKQMELEIVAQLRPQTPAADLDYLFAPLKHARLDYMAQKAVEMGAGRLRPVTTRRTQVARVNLERLRANAIEAAEQCGILSIPEIDPLVPLAGLLEKWPSDRTLVFCDEDAGPGDPIAALAAIRGPVAVLIGPEGGFDAGERDALLALPATVRIGLGPRILRADTAAVAALTLVQALAGDWRR